MPTKEQIKQYLEDGFVIPDFKMSENDLLEIEEKHNQLINKFPEYKNYCPAVLLKDESFLNYKAVVGELEISNIKTNKKNILKPEIRIYENPQTLTYEAAIKTGFLKDYYLTMSNIDRSDYYNYVLTSGEEFVPIFTIPTNRLSSAVDFFKKNLRVSIVNIGSVLNGSGVTTDEYDLNQIHSFDHFK